ncbi:MAG: peptide chain release factor N(5)-glutamine methyltransferase [Pseudomonadota bacterium]
MTTRSESLARAQDTLREFGGPDARLSAELLLSFVLKIDRTALFRDRDHLLPDEERIEFERFVERRRSGEPVAYLTGEREFFSLPFFVDRSVLIPRPETERLVEIALEKLSETPSARVVDVGTGPGTIAIALKKQLPTLDMTGIDVSEAALAVARRNAERNSVSIRWLQGDLLADFHEAITVVTANLPYIPTGKIITCDPGVSNFEPRLALDGGPDGLDLFRRLIPQARTRLIPGGSILLEIGEGQEDGVRKLLQTSGFTIESTQSDLAGIPRVIVGRSE